MKTILCGTGTATLHFVHADGPHVSFSDPVLAFDMLTVNDALPPGWKLGPREFPKKEVPLSQKTSGSFWKLVAPTHALLERRADLHLDRYWIRALGASWEEVRQLASSYYERAHLLSPEEARVRTLQCRELRLTPEEAAGLAHRWMTEECGMRMVWDEPDIGLWKVERGDDEHVLVRGGKVVAAIRGVAMTNEQEEALAARIEKLLNIDEYSEQKDP